MSDSVRPHRWQPTRLPRPWDSPGKDTGVGCHFLLQCMKVKSESVVAQPCPTLSEPVDCSLPGSSVHGIFQARVLEWGAIAFSNNIWVNIKYNTIEVHWWPSALFKVLANCALFYCSLCILKYLCLILECPVLLPGESHGQRSLVGCSPWGR